MKSTNKHTHTQRRNSNFWKYCLHFHLREYNKIQRNQPGRQQRNSKRQASNSAHTHTHTGANTQSRRVTLQQEKTHTQTRARTRARKERAKKKWNRFVKAHKQIYVYTQITVKRSQRDNICCRELRQVKTMIRRIDQREKRDPEHDRDIQCYSNAMSPIEFFFCPPSSSCNVCVCVCAFYSVSFWVLSVTLVLLGERIRAEMGEKNEMDCEWNALAHTHKNANSKVYFCSTGS